MKLDHFMIIGAGRVCVRVGDREVARLGEGSFTGEMSFLTGKETSASVWAITETRYLSWWGVTLQAFMEGHPRLALSLQQILGADVVEKLRASAGDGRVYNIVRSLGGSVHADEATMAALYGEAPVPNASKAE